VITPANLRLFVTNTNVSIGRAYKAKTPLWPAFASEEPVTGRYWTTGWTGQMTKMRIWLGRRVTHEAYPQTYTVEMLPFENSWSIDRFDLDDAIIPIYYREAEQFAEKGAMNKDFQLVNLIEGQGVYSSSPRSYGPDGVAMWSTVHPVDVYDSTKGTYINDFTGGGQAATFAKAGGGTTSVTVGGAISPAAIATISEYMPEVKGEDGEPLQVRPDMLMHAPILQTEVDLILKAMFFAPPSWGTITGQVGAADNVLRMRGITPFTNDYLVNLPTTFYMLCTKRGIKPWAWLNREEVHTVPRVSETDENVYAEHRLEWGMWSRGAPAPMFPWLMARSGP
jgi:phage major head subunit gpT-like protein